MNCISTHRSSPVSREVVIFLYMNSLVPKRVKSNGCPMSDLYIVVNQLLSYCLCALKWLSASNRHDLIICISHRDFVKPLHYTHSQQDNITMVQIWHMAAIGLTRFGTKDFIKIIVFQGQQIQQADGLAIVSIPCACHAEISSTNHACFVAQENRFVMQM